MSVSFTRFSPDTNITELTTQLIECYREVFAESPWHEWFRCQECEGYWGKEDKAELVENEFQHCGKPVIPFWPHHKVLSNIKRELSAEKSSCWLALDNKQVVGFCWGYQITLENLEEELGVQISADPLSESLRFTDPVVYQSELGVRRSHRQQGIGKQLVLKRLKDLRQWEAEYTTTRVRKSPEQSITYKWYRRLNFKVIASYGDGRAVVGREIAGFEEKI